MGLVDGLLLTASPFNGGRRVPDLAPRLVEREVAEHGCGLPPVEFVVLVATPVSLSGKISGRRGLGGHIVRWLSVFRLVSLREGGPGGANLGVVGVGDPLHRSDYSVGCRSQSPPEFEQAGRYASEEAGFGPGADLLDAGKVLCEAANY